MEVSVARKVEEEEVGGLDCPETEGWLDGQVKRDCCLKKALETTQWTCRWLEEEEGACP